METPIQLWLLITALIALPSTVALAAHIHLRRMARRRDDLWDTMAKLFRERQTLAPRLAAIANLYVPWDDPLVNDVTVARRHAMAAREVTERARAEADLSWALARLIQTAEDHPQLIRHADFKAATRRIASVEAKVARLRLAYNRDAILVSDRLTRSLTGILGRLTGITSRDPFDLDPLLAREAMMASLAHSPPPRPPIPGT